MDDPEVSILYDPQRDGYPELVITNLVGGPNHGLAALSPASPTAGSTSSNDIEQTQYVIFQGELQQPPKGPEVVGQPKVGGLPDITAPRLPYTIEALPDLGALLIRATNPEDLKALLDLIERIQEFAAKTELQIEIVPLARADATSVANYLQQLYGRVVIGPFSTYLQAGNTQQRPAGQQGGNVGGQQGGPGAQLGAPTVGTATAAVSNAYVYLYPLPRFNAILVAAGKSRLDDVKKHIQLFDKDFSPDSQAKAFQLKHQPASRVAGTLQSFWSTRFPNEPLAQNQVRFTYDDATNTVWVQASPADMEQIAAMILFIDGENNNARNDLRVVPLRNAISDDLANLLSTAIRQIVYQSTTAPGQIPTGAQATAAPAAAFAAGGTVAQVIGGGVGPNKYSVIRFLSNMAPGSEFSASILEDIHIFSDTRTNALLINAPEKTMVMLLALIRELDVAPHFAAQVRVFQLRKANAAAVTNILSQMLLGTTSTTGGGAKAATGTTGTTSQLPPTLSMTGQAPDGAVVVPIRLTYDDTTNSVIVAGSENDLDVVGAVVAKLEQQLSPLPLRRTETFQLYYAQAADAATTLTTYYTNQMTVFTKSPLLGDTNWLEMQRDIIVIAEPVTNKLIVSVSPQYYEEVAKLVMELDSPPAQVIVDCLIAEVDLNGDEEFGCEIGIQSPVLFDRGNYPAAGYTTGSSSTFGTTILPSGGTVSTSSPANPIGNPGFLWNTGATPSIGNNVAVQPTLVGYQGMTNLGTNRVSPNAGIGGFVFSASSDSVSVLVRALMTQGRIQVLSRPQIQTSDNQAARVLVGQDYPYVTGFTNSAATTGLPITQSTVAYKDVGVQLQVTPKIAPDNTVIMRVVPEVSSATTSNISLGQGIFATAFNVQTVETTIICQDGETVALGGIITSNDNKLQNSVPWFGDLPWIGSLFRYRQQLKSKTELMVILTPHVCRSRADREVGLVREANKMDWDFKQVVKAYGATNLEPLMPRPSDSLPGCMPYNGQPTYGPYQPYGQPPMYQPPMYQQPGVQPEYVPQPRPLPQQGQGYLMMPSSPPPPQAGQSMAPPVTQQSYAPQAYPQQMQTPAYH